MWGDGSGYLLAVGENGIMLQYDNDEWAPITSPVTNSLRAIWGASRDELFAVGDDGIVRYHGGEWTVTPAPGGVWLAAPMT